MKKVLIVDDQEKITRVYGDLLKREGYGVTEANDSHSAMNILITHPEIRLVLLDIEMPKIDGGTLYEAVLQYDPDIRVIVSSVHPPDVQKKCIAGAAGYHEKFRSFDELLSKIKECCRQDVGI